MDVREAMTHRPVTVAPSQTIADAQSLMRRGRFRHLPVVADGTLAGVVTERDLHVAELGSWTPEVGNRPVRSVMTRNVITVAPDDPVEHAARLMLENKVGCLPVLEGSDLVGIITEADIFRAFVQVLGVMEPGTRIQLRATNLAEALERIPTWRSRTASASCRWSPRRRDRVPPPRSSYASALRCWRP
jgi:acetoin utilization protein AcuB